MSNRLDGILTPDEKKIWIEESNIWREQQPQNPLVNRIKEILYDEDGDVIIYFGGSKGKGKSTAMIKLLMQIDPEWVPWMKMGFSIREVLQITKIAKQGWGVAWDETGNKWSKYRAMSGDSLVMDNVLTIVRERNLCFAFTGVTFSDIAKGGRRLVALFVSLYKKGEGTLYDVWVDSWNANMGRNNLGSFEFDKLPDILYTLYKKFRTDFVDWTIEEGDKEILFREMERILPPVCLQAWKLLFLSGGLRYSEIEASMKKGSAQWIVSTLTNTGCAMKDDGKYIATVPRYVR